MPADAAVFRTLIDACLEPFQDRASERSRADWGYRDASGWDYPLEKMVQLRAEKPLFFARHDYDWCLAKDAYNYPMEVELQWRLLNVLSDMVGVRDMAPQCANIVVRILSSASTRAFTLELGQAKIIAITEGYLTTLKAFCRVWLRGCALGGLEVRVSPFDFNSLILSYEAAIRNEEERLMVEADAFVASTFALLHNEIPVADYRSIFDNELPAEIWMPHFAFICNAVDGFTIFHEAAHILRGDVRNGRSLDVELRADKGAASLSIIDEARRGRMGTPFLGAPVFFAMEFLRLACEEILELMTGRHQMSQGRYPGIAEIKVRRKEYGAVFSKFLKGQMDFVYEGWLDAVELVFNTCRAMLYRVFDPSLVPSLEEFIFVDSRRPPIPDPWG